jgi:hypothetical protein
MVWINAAALLRDVVQYVLDTLVSRHNIHNKALTVFVHLPGGMTMLAAARLQAMVEGVIRSIPEQPCTIEVKVLMEFLSAALSTLKTLHLKVSDLPKKMLLLDIGGATLSMSLNHIGFAPGTGTVISFMTESSITMGGLAGWDQNAIFLNSSNSLLHSCFHKYAKETDTDVSYA